MHREIDWEGIKRSNKGCFIKVPGLKEDFTDHTTDLWVKYLFNLDMEDVIELGSRLGFSVEIKETHNVA